MTAAFVVAPFSGAASVVARRAAGSARFLAAETGGTTPPWDVFSSSSAPDASSISSSMLGNTLQLASSSSDTIIATTTATPTTFEPIAPDATALLGFASIVVLCAVAAWVWANQVVPVSRTNLALSKRNGPVKEYLDELRQAAAVEEAAESTATTAPSFNNAPTTSTTGLAATEEGLDTEALQGSALNSTAVVSKNDRSFERWLFTDWLEKPPAQGGRQKPSALPVLKDAKWNSGDNPVLAATGLITLGVLFTAVTERIVQVSPL